VAGLEQITQGLTFALSFAPFANARRRTATTSTTVRCLASRHQTADLLALPQQ
jgi:hypothetical protein